MRERAEAGGRPMKTVVGYWLATALVGAAFIAPGIGNLVHAPSIAHDMAQLGYPAYFSTILGAWKVLGALAVLAPGLPVLKEWAYAGMVFDLTGAAASRGVNGDGAVMVLVPLALCTMVLLSRSLRPASRRLTA